MVLSWIHLAGTRRVLLWQIFVFPDLRSWWGLNTKWLKWLVWKSTSVLFQPDHVFTTRMFWETSFRSSPSSQRRSVNPAKVSVLFCVSPLAPLYQLVSLLPAIPNGALDMTICADETGSEEDLYEDVHSSSHHYSHSGGGGEQLAINEVESGLCWWREGLAIKTTPVHSCRPRCPQSLCS